MFDSIIIGTSLVGETATYDLVKCDNPDNTNIPATNGTPASWEQ